MTVRDADVVIIDEAHHFRNPGIEGEGVKAPSRYRQLQQYLQSSDRPKQVYSSHGHAGQQLGTRLPPHDRAVHRRQ